jgi:hypothetical protein
MVEGGDSETWTFTSGDGVREEVSLVDWAIAKPGNKISRKKK